MKLFKSLNKLSFLSFAALLIITSTLIVACSQGPSNIQSNVGKNSESTEQVVKEYKLPPLNDDYR